MLFGCAIRRERIIKAVATKHGRCYIATRRGGARNRTGWRLFSDGGCFDLLLICPLCDVCSQYERRGISVLRIYMPGRLELYVPFAVLYWLNARQALKYRTPRANNFGDLAGCRRMYPTYSSLGSS
jgi:hypothetical protein